MGYLTGIITGCFSNMLFLIFLVAFVGYLLGNIKIKGVGLGTAGVFLIALLFGHFGFADTSLLHQIGLITLDEATMKAGMSVIQNIGLICFVTSVGFIAGPNFFHNLKKNATSYVMLAVIIIAAGSLTCVAITVLTKVDSAMAVGVLCGALTTTPGFSAAQDAIGDNEFLLNEVTVGHGIAYPFGVVGVVLFVQLVPKLLHADMESERAKIRGGEDAAEKKGIRAKLIDVDPIGLAPFSLAVILGIALGKVGIPLPGGAVFSLGNTGGPLIMGLILGHFGHIGRINMRITNGFLTAFREFGLVMFLIGAGVPGGSGFVEILREYGFVLFIYGAVMTTVPMILGFFFARYVVKLSLFNNLGSITGGMTSTPALGALISTTGTDDVAASYAATYPAALILIVLASQFIVTFL